MKQQSNNLSTRYYIKTESNGIISAGTIQTVTDDRPVPEGWLECDGSEYDPEKYPELADALTVRKEVYRQSFLDRLRGKKGKFWKEVWYTPYGEGRLPDFRGKIVR